MSMSQPESELSLLRQELVHLSERTADLGGKMGGLAGALESVTQLQIDQRKIEATAVRASSRVEEVAAQSATKDELAEIGHQRRRAVRNLYIALITGTLAVLTIGLGGVAAATAYHDQQRHFQRAQYDNCIARNESATATRGLIRDLIQAERASIDPPTAARLIQALQAAEAKTASISCANLLKG
jgi:hypothetical protein